MAKAKPTDEQNLIAQNRRARFDYAVTDTFEAGLVLTGSEVKSLRAGGGNIAEAYAVFMGDELMLIGSHIAKYSHGGYANHEEIRTRKLLLHRKELDKLQRAVARDGMAVVPLKLYWKVGYAKCLLGLAQGKKTIDKRATIKEREWNIQKQRLLKR